MSIAKEIKNLIGIDWKKNHQIPEEGITFQEFIDSGEIAVGDMVKIENKAECVHPLSEGEYCLTFKKEFKDGGTFFTEECFTKEECKILFGNDFDY